VPVHVDVDAIDFLIVNGPAHHRHTASHDLICRRDVDDALRQLVRRVRLLRAAGAAGRKDDESKTCNRQATAKGRDGHTGQ
jgi:hypothetical protein